jgi:hypothetical protein
MDNKTRIYVNMRIASALFFVVAINRLFDVEMSIAVFITALIFLVPAFLIWVGRRMQGLDGANADPGQDTR